MKKNKFLKLFLTFICILGISIVSDNVYGYQLKFKAYKDDINNTEGALVRTFGQTFGTATPGSWKDVGKNNDSVSYGDGSYATYKIVFHNAKASTYDTSYDGNYFYVGYDVKKDNKIFELTSDLTDDALVNKLKVEGTTVKGYNKQIYSSSSFNSEMCLEYGRVSDNFYLNRERIISSDDPNETRTLSEWYLSENVIKNIRTKFNLNNENSFVYFSLPSKTQGATWNTTYDMLSNMENTGKWHPANYGKTVWYLKGYKDDLDKTPGKTALNLFDNQLYISNEFLAPQDIYIRHVDEKGNLINIANSAEVLINSSGDEKIKNNGETANKHTEYQEYYKINLGERMRVSRSLTMAVNGKMYKYKNAIVSTAKDFASAKTLDNIKTNNNTRGSASFEVGGSDSNKTVTIVTFVYSEDDVPGYPTPPETPPGDDPPSGDIYTDFSSDTDTSDCIQKYTPTGEYITPYLKANKTLLKDLVYKLEQDDDKVEYKMKSFNVQKLDGGKIDDNLVNYPNTGKIFGNESYTLLAANSKKELKIKDFSLDAANKFKNDYNKGSLPEQSVIDNFVKNQSKSGYEDFNLDENRRLIPEDKYNGVRNPKLSAHYKAVNVINGNDISGGLGYIDANNKVNIIVYNPLDLDDVKVTSKEIINHTTSSSSNTNVIQKNADFTVSFGTKSSSHYASISDTSKYLDYYYLIFDIDVVLKSNYQVKERTSTGFTSLKTASAGSTVTAGTLIRINKGDTEFNAIASSNKQGEDIVSQVENNVVLIGVTNNMPSDALENLIFTNAVKKYVVKNETIEEKYINTTTSTNLITFKDYCDEKSEEITNHESTYTSNHQMYSDAYYFAMARAKTTNIGRIYDFKVTDCSDIDYKKVFRKSDTLNSVNDLTGVQYFSGVKLFNIYANEINTLEDRPELNIDNNSNSKKIIPLGPYKNTNTSYVSAPKMGYRISFDLKTSGFYDQTTTSTREILIKPSYYYISKNGETFEDNINLYYKNSSGKYVNFVGSDYTIYFKPKDGYRSIANSVTAGNTTLMSDQLEPLKVGSSSGFTLDSKMMSTADNKFIQAWYGEFKLPNSTIAVKGNNISNPLTDGYIGVKFEIKSIDKDASGKIIREISYNQDNQNAEKKTNTTQWDYEGFLGFTNYGKAVDKITLQLEKGNWEINNSTYQKIKGSVVLFDTDNRAANDFD